MNNAAFLNCNYILVLYYEVVDTTFVGLIQPLQITKKSLEGKILSI